MDVLFLVWATYKMASLQSWSLQRFYRAQQVATIEHTTEASKQLESLIPDESL
jgi:hypothetical protein